jgi:N-acetylneuraminic acid mutarotase
MKSLLLHISVCIILVMIYSANTTGAGSITDSEPSIENGEGTLLLTFCRDSDGGSYGNAAFSIEACEAPDAFIEDNTDRNNLNADVNLAATEVCNDIDDDFNDSIDADSWVERSSLPTPRSGAAAAVVDGKIYVIGGYSSDVMFAINECYNPETDTWTTLAPMPRPRSGAFASVVDGKIYVIGGVDETTAHTSSLNESYDPKTDTWTTMAPMPTCRAVPFAATVDGKIYVMGGIGGNMFSFTDSAAIVDVVSAANEEYDPSNDRWTKKRSMLTPRCRPAGSVADNNIYVIGGWGHDGITNINEQYSPETDSWSTLAPMPTRRTATVASVVNNKIFVIGGYLPKNDSETMSQENMLLIAINEEYDIASDTWTSRKPMANGRAGTIACVIDGKIYVIGGAVIDSTSSNLTYSDLNEEYTPPH